MNRFRADTSVNMTTGQRVSMVVAIMMLLCATVAAMFIMIFTFEALQILSKDEIGWDGIGLALILVFMIIAAAADILVTLIGLVMCRILRRAQSAKVNRARIIFVCYFIFTALLSVAATVWIYLSVL